MGFWRRTGGTTLKERQQARRLGLTLTMPKPFEPSEFYAAIEQFIPKERWQIYETPKGADRRSVFLGDGVRERSQPE